MSVVWTWHGAVTPTSVWVRARISGASAQLRVSQSADLSGAVTLGPVTPDAVDMASIEVTGLEPSTRYYYRWVVDSVPQGDFDGTLLTAPPNDGSPQSFTIGAAGDAGLAGAAPGAEHISDGISNHPIFDTMRQRALDEDWIAFCHLGDFFYRDNQSTALSHFRDTYDDVLTFNGTAGAEARQGQFFRGVNMTLAQDDHDLMANNTNRTSAGRDSALQVYRESAPHYPLPAGEGAEAIHQSWRWGRVQFIQSDVRAHRDPNANFDTVPDTPKTLLGTEQKRWMEQVLRNSDAAALVWIMPSLWMSDVGEVRNAGVSLAGGDWSGDSWRRFRREREEIVELLGDHGWLHRTVQLTADKHALSIATGPANPWGRFPVFMFASMDASFDTGLPPEAQYDIGQSAGRRRYGTLRVEDAGHTIALHGTGYIGNTVWKSYTGYAHVESRTLAVSYSQLHPPLDPTDDDQRLVNDVTAERQDGGQFRYELEEGPASIQDPPQGVGRYSSSETLNVPSDADLPPQAGWRVHKGTVDDARYPAVTVNLADHQIEDLRPEVAGVDVGDRITIEDPPGFLPPERIDLVVEGYEETINTHEWEITYNTSPAETLRDVARVAPDLILNTNHDFEASVAGWESVGASLARAVAHARRGIGAAQQIPNGVSSVARTRTRLADSPKVHPGLEYTFTAWVRSATGHAVDMSVQWFDVDDADISFPFILPSTPLTAGVWTLVAGSAVAPEGAHRVQWNINQRPDPAATDLLWIDEATITNGSQAALQPSDPNRVDTTGSELAEGAGEQDTELLVLTQLSEQPSARWINSEGPTITHPLHFPFDVHLGGERVRITACEPAGWDPFRTSRPGSSWGTAESGHAWIDTLVADTNLGAVSADQYGFIQLLDSPPTLRHQRLDLGVALADCEVLWTVRTNQISTGSAQLPSLLLRRVSDSDYYRSRLNLNTDGTVSLSVARGTTEIGSAVNLPLLEYAASAALADRIFVRTRLIGHRILARAWRVTDLSGVGGIGNHLDHGFWEPDHWQIDRTITDTADTIDAGQIGFSASTQGGYTGTSPSQRFQLIELVTPQRMTVQRSLNGVVKTHGAGTRVHLHTPAVIGL